MITKEKVISRIEAQIALCKEIDSDWMSLTVGTGKRILELIREKPHQILCKECKYGTPVGKWVFCHCTKPHQYATHGGCFEPDWFCADGERKEGR